MEAEHATLRSLPALAEDHALPGELRRLIARLPASQQEALELTRIHGFSLRAAAAVCGRTPGALKVAVHRGTRRRREAIAAL